MCITDINNNIKLKDSSIIFAKINLPVIPNNLSNNNIAYGTFYFYDKNINRVDKLKIEILSSTGELLKINSDFDLTLEIQEYNQVLKDTLIDTKTGNINTVK